MVPVLHPEILLKIIRYACAEDDGTVACGRYRKRELARLMRVSKIFNQLCTPELYADCDFDKPRTFFDTLFPDQEWHTNSLNPDFEPVNASLPREQYRISMVQTLRVSQPPFPRVDSHKPVKSVSGLDWNDAYAAYSRDDSPPPRRHRSNRGVFDVRPLYNFSLWLRRAIKMEISVLPNLERVVMMGNQEDKHGMSATDLKGFPDALANLPSVKYCCQNRLYGPLSFRNDLVKPLHPPITATFHIPQDDFRDPGWGASLPIIIGATNRYICSWPNYFGEHGPPNSSQFSNQWQQALWALVSMMLRRKQVRRELLHINQPYKYVAIDSMSLNGTKIELYNVIDRRAEPWMRPPIEREIVQPDGSVRQALTSLVDTNFGLWKGKVSFPDFEDIPLCPACQIPETTQATLALK